MLTWADTLYVSLIKIKAGAHLDVQVLPGVEVHDVDVEVVVRGLQTSCLN